MGPLTIGLSLSDTSRPFIELCNLAKEKILNILESLVFQPFRPLCNQDSSPLMTPLLVDSSVHWTAMYLTKQIRGVELAVRVNRRLLKQETKKNFTEKWVHKMSFKYGYVQK